MGSTLTDTLVVAVGAGGTVSVLAQGLIAWLKQPRNSDVSVSVVAADGSRTDVKVTNVRDVETVIRAAASGGGERGPF